VKTTNIESNKSSSYSYVTLLGGLDKKLAARLVKTLSHVTTLKHVSTPKEVEPLLTKAPIGLIVTVIDDVNKPNKGNNPFIEIGLMVPILAIDSKNRIITIHPDAPFSHFGHTFHTWEDLPKLVTRLLQLASYRLESTLLLETLSAVSDNIKQGVIVVDRDLVVRSLNPAAKRACKFISPAQGVNLAKQKKGCIPKIAKLLKSVISSRQAKLKVSISCNGDKDENTEIVVATMPMLDHQGYCHGATAIVLDNSKTTPIPDIIRKRYNFYRIIGVSTVMQEMYDLIESLANMDTTTLITGESGVGKELVAEALHIKGGRSNGPLVKVNCSALQDNLLESELFGHVKGAFTGAVRDRPGRFEVASGGTIFLDEIGEVSMSMQTRLLRILQEKELERVGDSRTIKVDVRVVAATNKNLAQQVKLGKFREDLYFRLNVVEINVPPLRERPDDIPLLINHFIQRFNQKYTKSIVGVQDVVKEIFMHYNWPGNIRELENAIEHAFVVSRQNTIRIKHLPKALVLKRPCADPAQVSKVTESIPSLRPPQSEKEAIMHALEIANWKKKKAAKLLKISRSTFYRKLEKYGIKT
jgi:two-component system, NtrC family, response regulator HydG